VASTAGAVAREAQAAAERAEAERTLKRSEMSAKAKSDYIAKHGKDAYFEIPFK
jgi:hypothetical protein